MDRRKCARFGVLENCFEEYFSSLVKSEALKVVYDAEMVDVLSTFALTYSPIADVFALVKRLIGKLNT